MTVPATTGGASPSRRRAWWCAAVWVAAAGASAAELNYGVALTTERSSNVRRAPEVEQEETINSLLISARYRDILPTFRSEVSVSSERRDYQRDIFQDESLFQLDGTVVWLPTQQFSWTVADSFRNVPVSQALPDTPANREDTNVFLTGPGVEWRITPADHLIAEARYGRFDAERSDIDNDRHSAALRLRHRHSSLSEQSLNSEYLRVEFDNDLNNTNYRRHDLFYRGRFRPSRNELTTDLGYTSIDRDRLSEVSGSLFRLTAARDITSSRRMGVSLSSQYSDTAIDLAPSGITTMPAPGAAEVTSETLSGDIFYTKRGDIYLTSMEAPLPWTITAHASDIDYEESPSDVEEKGGSVTVSYVRTANLSFSIYSRYNRSDYAILDRVDRDVTNGTNVSLRLSRTLLLFLEGQRIERRSTDPLQSFKDDRVSLRLAYDVTRRWN